MRKQHEITREEAAYRKIQGMLSQAEYYALRSLRERHSEILRFCRQALQEPERHTLSGFSSGFGGSQEDQE